MMEQQLAEAILIMKGIRVIMIVIALVLGFIAGILIAKSK